MAVDIHPNLLALLSALFIAAARMLYQSALGRISPDAVTVLVNFVSVLFASAFYRMGAGADRWPLQGLLWFALVGFIGSFSGRYLSFVSQRLVGAARTSIVIQSMLVWSTLLAVLFLGERLTAPVAAGSLLILAGGVALVSERGGERRGIPWLHYLVPLVAAFTFALTFLIRRWGLAWIPSSALGMGVANGTSLVLMTAVLSLPGGRSVRRWDRRGTGVAVLGGMCNAFSAFCFWSAIQYGEVVQVVPINRLSVLFVIALSWMYFRKEEAVTWRVAAGGASSVAGAVLIAAGR